MATVNKKNVELAFKRQFWSSQSGKNLALGQAQVRINPARRKFIEEYNKHPVTLELRNKDGGSNTISYVGKRGTPNLFSFLGFDSGSDPLNILDQIVYLPRKARFAGLNGLVYSFSVPVPTEEEIHNAVENSFDGNIEWTSTAWTKLVDDGLPSNIANYVIFPEGIASSRSGNALQVAKINLSNNYSPPPYISKIVQVFNEELRRRFSTRTEKVQAIVL